MANLEELIGVLTEVQNSRPDQEDGYFIEL